MDMIKQPISKSLLLLTLGHTITDLSQGALPILLPFFKNAFALSYTQVGLIVLTQNFTSSVIQPIFGHLTDRMRIPWLVPFGLLLAGVGTAATGLATSYHLLLMIVVITGIGIASFHPQAAKSVHASSEPRVRGRNMGVFLIGGNLGQASGSVFMMALLAVPGATSNTTYFCIPAVILSVLLWVNLSRTSTSTNTLSTGRKLVAASGPIPYFLVGILLLFIFFRSSIASGLTTYLPLYFVNYLGGSPLNASYLISGYMLSGVAGTYIGGTLGDIYGRKTVIKGSMLLTLPLLILFKYATVFWTFPLVMLIGFTYIASFSSTMVLAQEMMPGREGLAASLTTGFSQGLGGVAATIFGFIADQFGIPSVFTVIALIPIGMFFLASLFPGKLFKPDCETVTS